MKLFHNILLCISGLFPILKNNPKKIKFVKLGIFSEISVPVFDLYKL